MMKKPGTLGAAVFFIYFLAAVACPACGGRAPSVDGGSADGEAAYDAGDGGVFSDASYDAGADPFTGIAPGGPVIRRMLGVSSHMYQGPGDNAERNFEFGTYKALGGMRIREDYHWSQIEPARGEWRFEGVDPQVQMAGGYGVEITVLLVYGVDWAMKNGETSTIDPADYAGFAGKVAARYCDTVKTYEIWNEPDLVNFWKPGPDPVHYGNMLAAAAPAIRTVCPDAKILLGGQSSYSNLLHRWWFMEEVFASRPELCSLFDILALHPYTVGQAPSPEKDFIIDAESAMEGQSLMTGIARERLAAMGCPEKPLWFTEMGWPSYEIGEEAQGRFLARSILLAARDGVEAYFWYTFWDGEPITTGPRPHENYFGFFGWPFDKVPNRTKPAYLAFRGLIGEIGGMRFAKDLSTALGLPNDVYVLAFADDKTGLVLAMWDGRDNPDVFEGKVQPGGPGTSHALALRFPDGWKASGLHSIDGTPLAMPAAGPDGTLGITLTPSVQYLKTSR
jgi:hypothetical protein